jgi:hypothetical protein
MLKHHTFFFSELLFQGLEPYGLDLMISKMLYHQTKNGILGEDPREWYITNWSRQLSTLVNLLKPQIPRHIIRASLSNAGECITTTPTTLFNLIQFFS